MPKFPFQRRKSKVRCIDRQYCHVLRLEALEQRELLAALNNSGAGRTEAFLDVEVNEFGAFGNAIALDVARSDIPDQNTIGNAFYDLRDQPPAPPIESVGYAYESAIAIGINFQAGGYTREFLTAGCVNYQASRFNANQWPTNACADIREGQGATAANNPTDARFDQFSQPAQGLDNRTSTFFYPNSANADNAQIRITLKQELIEHEYLGGPSGTSLVQTYELEILSPTINTVEIVRYMDADVYDGDSPIADGGGHRLVGVTVDQDSVYTVNRGTNTPLNDNSIVDIFENHRDFGGYPQQGTNRWEIGRATGNDTNGYDFNVPWPLVCPITGPCKTHPWLDTWPVSTYTPPNGNGDAIKPRAFPISQESPYLVARIMAGVPLANDITVNGGFTGPDFNGQTQTYGQPGWDAAIGNYDADDNDAIDFGLTADVSMALSNQYVNVNQGDRIVYQVNTKFGDPPIGTPPPQPTTANLTGRLFADLNGNGQFDAGERGLKDWTVFNDLNGDGVVGPGEIQDRTDSDGFYLLELPESTGNNIALLQRNNWTQTVPLGTGLTAPGSYGPIDITMADLGQRLIATDFGFPSFDFGVDPDPATIFGFVFEDDNANGVRDAGEGPLTNWEVFADFNRDGVQQLGEVATTDAAGRYEFPNVDPGTYVVSSAPEVDYELTKPASGRYSPTVQAGQTVNAGNFGFRLIRAFISGVKFNDLNADGIRQDDEPPMSNVLIFIDRNDDGIINLGDRSSRTDAQGRFSFNEIRPGDNIVIAESLSLGTTQTFPTENNGRYILNLDPGASREDLLFGNRFITVDYGDAPFPFPTSIQASGPAHEIDPNFRIGPTVTAESIPAINSTATGDSSDDGVTLIGGLNPGSTGTVRVNAFQDGGVLQGWIDFNRDGDWLDDGEQIFTNRPLAAGSNTLNFPVPTTAVGGIAFARYRYSSEMDLEVTGLAADGEVEDYRYTIAGGGGGGLPTSYTNPANNFDVDNNGTVALSDALAIVTSLRNGGARDLPPPTPGQQPPPFVDVNGDNRVNISDALAVIRQIIRERSMGEGEALAASKVASQEPLPVAEPKSSVTESESVEQQSLDTPLLAEMAVSDRDSTAACLPLATSEDSEELDATLDDIALDVGTAWQP